jgi:hypothetical protein
MADYHPLIARAVDGLENSTGEARRALYERARSALVSQLRSIEPALSEADITRERLALEDAIRRVEADSVRKARADRPAPPLRPSPARAPLSPATPNALRRDGPGPALGHAPGAVPRPELGRPAAQRPEPSPLRMQSDSVAGEAPTPASAASARARLLNARTSPVPREGFKSFRGVVNEVDDLGAATAKSAQSARDTRDSYGAAPVQQFPDDDELPPVRDRLEPAFDGDEADVLDDELPTARGLEPGDDATDDGAAAPHFARPHPPRAREPEQHYEEPRPPRSYRGLAKLAVVLIVLAGLTATISWQWSNITGLYRFVSHLRSKPTQTAQTPAAQPKFPGRVPQEQLPGQQQAPGAGTGQNTTQNAPQVAQRVVLYEEDPNNPQGRQFIGSAIWRTETVSPGSGLAPELEVRADITIPERNMTVTWTLRRNTDQALPASHTIEIMFNLPPDFPGGGIANVPGVLMKESEQARGVPLAGLAVKVTNGFFLIGLSAVATDVQRNVQLLKDRPWFDIPIVYNNGGRAILAMEKGPPGDRAFADAFAAWAK